MKIGWTFFRKMGDLCVWLEPFGRGTGIIGFRGIRKSNFGEWDEVQVDYG